MSEQISLAVSSIERTDLVIGLTYAVGTRSKIATDALTEHLKEFNYCAHVIKLSHKVLATEQPDFKNDSYKRIEALMNQGNRMREKSEDWGILALSAIELIQNRRRSFEVSKTQVADESKQDQPSGEVIQDQLPGIVETNSQVHSIEKGHSDTGSDPELAPEDGDKEPFGHAFIISSLKHPHEVERLREVYSSAFFLIAINENEDQRRTNLMNTKNIRKSEADKLIERDAGENEPFGQHTRDVFEMADIHLTLNLNTSNGTGTEEDSEDALLKRQVDRQIARILDLMFGHPFITPTFDEYAMFMAYASGLRSADLSRQTGAIITNRLQEIVATGANEVPQFGGGQYWPNPNTFEDAPGGRDYTKGFDTNRKERIRIVDEIVDIFNFDERKEEDKKDARESLLRSSIKYLTEYSRPVHAEMSAIIACARSGISLDGSTLYCSTFPCHNCAKHIISAGIRRVVFIEPYPKSKTMELYSDSATISREEKKVSFEEFVGIGPRRFFDFFSLKLSSGRSIMRQDANGIVQWDRATARLRNPLVISYPDREKLEMIRLSALRQKIKAGNQE